MKKKSIALTLTAVMLALAVGIGGTIAYFTSTTGEVKNVFTTSSGIDITLDEDKINPDTWEKVGTEKTKEGNTYNNIYPSAVLPKNPTIHVEEDSEKAYVAMKVQVSNVAEWKAIAEHWNITNLETIFGGYEEDNWQKVYADVDSLTFVFMWEADKNGDGKGVVKAGDDCELFKTVTIPAELTNDEVKSLNNFKITAIAYAVQANGLTYETAKPELAKLIGGGITLA